MVNDTTNTLTDTDSDATSKIHRTAGKKKDTGTTSYRLS